MLSSTKGIKCKKCGDRFLPYHNNSMQKFCMKKDECITAHKELVTTAKNTAEAHYRANRKEKKQWSQEKKVIKDKLKTRTDWLNEVQVIFNEFIRLRDKGLPCISCAKNNEVKWNAGHYRSVGGNPELRFNELNVWKQCEHCNTYLHGNLIEYRKGLVKKIGFEQVEFLEGPHEPKHYTIPELIELKVIYKDKIKQLKTKTD